MMHLRWLVCPAVPLLPTQNLDAATQLELAHSLLDTDDDNLEQLLFVLAQVLRLGKMGFGGIMVQQINGDSYSIDGTLEITGTARNAQYQEARTVTATIPMMIKSALALARLFGSCLMQ